MPDFELWEEAGGKNRVTMVIWIYFANCCCLVIKPGTSWAVVNVFIWKSHSCLSSYLFIVSGLVSIFQGQWRRALGNLDFIQFVRQCMNLERHLLSWCTALPLFHCHVWVSSLQCSSFIQKPLVRLQCSFYNFNWMRSPWVTFSFMHSLSAQVYNVYTTKSVKDKETCTYFNLTLKDEIHSEMNYILWRK